MQTRLSAPINSFRVLLSLLCSPLRHTGGARVRLLSILHPFILSHIFSSRTQLSSFDVDSDDQRRRRAEHLSDNLLDGTSRGDRQSGRSTPVRNGKPARAPKIQAQTVSKRLIGMPMLVFNRRLEPKACYSCFCLDV